MNINRLVSNTLAPIHVPDFQVYEEGRINGVFQRLVIRPVRRAGYAYSDHQIQTALVNLFKCEISRRIRALHPFWSEDQIFSRTRGVLSAVNIDDARFSHFDPHPIDLYGLTIRYFARHIEEIHQSSANIQIWDLEWTFFLDPNRIIVGGAGNKKPSYIPSNVYPDTWLDQTVNEEPISCLAFSLATWERRFVSNRRRNPERHLLATKYRARRMMEQFRWEKYVAASEIEKYLIENPTLRVTFLRPHINEHAPFSFEGTEWVYDASDRNTIYILYSEEDQHYGLVSSPQEVFMKARSSQNIRWCNFCQAVYQRRSGHVCNAHPTEKVTRSEKCKACESRVCDGKCLNCDNCHVHLKNNPNSNHRCILYKDPERSKSKIFLKYGERKKGYKLYAYDLESRMNRVEGTETLEFLTDEDSYILDGNNQVQTITVEKSEHIVNLVAFKDVYSNEPTMVYYGDNALDRFIDFMINSNDGRNICCAHNGSGYDSRLIFERAKLIVGDQISIQPITRGCKFMQLTIGKAVFRDTMLHLKGSLKNLARDYLGDSNPLRKGHFPHLFNTEANRNFVGPIPEKKYFDMVSTAKTNQDIVEFNEWYDSFQGEWDFMRELEAYCVNDVEVLAAIMKKYDEINQENTGMSPWFNATAPSFFHEHAIRNLCSRLNLSEDPEERAGQVDDLARNHFWSVLIPSEYWFVRCCMRGGRVEVRKIYHHVSNEDWAAGIRIRYVDVVSLYPYVQVVHRYPVGTPKIEIYDSDFTPCYKHRNRPESHCRLCSLYEKRLALDSRLDITFKDVQPTREDILHDPSFFGFVCATVIPPKNLYHPVLVYYDENMKKCIASLEDIEKGCFTTPEFIRAVSLGYEVVKIHRLDRYNSAESKWCDIIKPGYLQKMLNSSNIPSQEEQDRIVREHAEEFGPEFGQQIKDSFPSWGKNPARKQTSKIGINSGWGKHAQRPIMPEVKILHRNNAQDHLDIFNDFTSGTYQVQDILGLTDELTFYRFMKNGQDTNPNLHDSYLPAACFVPAYGRLMLFDQLHQLGKRVLMHDTDSIIYLYDPSAEYNILTGDRWGQWDVEDIDSKHGGLRTFVGLCPKSYGLKAADGQPLIKLKGLSLKYSTRDIVNFDVMESLVQNYLRERNTTTIKVPQMTFQYSIGKKMMTHYYLKDLAFRPNDLKGTLDDEGYIYPFGYESE